MLTDPQAAVRVRLAHVGEQRLAAGVAGEGEGLGALVRHSILSSFLVVEPDTSASDDDTLSMAKALPAHRAVMTAKQIRSRVRRGGERFWRHTDFAGLPPAAVSQALSRLTKRGELERVRKGLYYRSRPTVLGASRPAPDAVAVHSARGRLHPAGLTAANYLGFTTQNPARPEYASSASSAPRALAGAHVYTRRPRREGLSERESAILELLRDRARTSDLGAEGTCARLLDMLDDPRIFARLTKAAADEPPRVRAMLGAAGEQLGMDERLLSRLRASLNPLSRYDFGTLKCLQTAGRWQVKNR